MHAYDIAKIEFVNVRHFKFFFLVIVDSGFGQIALKATSFYVQLSCGSR